MQGNNYAQQAPVVAQGPHCLLERRSPAGAAKAPLGGHAASSRQLQRRVSQLPGLSRTSSADPSTFIPLTVTPEVERMLKVTFSKCKISERQNSVKHVLALFCTSSADL